jgi:hypothetical protein
VRFGFGAASQSRPGRLRGASQSRRAGEVRDVRWSRSTVASHVSRAASWVGGCLFALDVLADRRSDLGRERSIVCSGDLEQLGADLWLDVRVNLHPAGSDVLLHAEIFAAERAGAHKSGAPSL